MEKCGRAGQATDGSIIWHLLSACWISKATHRHALRICNTYCFSMVTVVMRKRLDVTFIHTLPVFLFYFIFPFILCKCKYKGQSESNAPCIRSLCSPVIQITSTTSVMS
jgi:hypothetical protein